MAKTKWPNLPRYFIPLFHSANIYLCRSVEEWKLACKHLAVDAGEIDTLSGAAQTYSNNETNENIYLIGIFDGELSTLVHECAHVAFYTCRDVGVTIDTNAANETYCYLLDRMVSHFLPYIQDKTKSK
ncbi:hypothetical protein [Yersinia aldovae]|uniref:hypothetical protein n=1 Tax=Yersinia aldovae TaxID=29483 RepID=UPI0005AC2AE5|nr:hypothetical protein [Yersinia aldovae]AJJ64486.1 hypothetical protein AT01_1322 [Yersinia aldovae 670-83]